MKPLILTAITLATALTFTACVQRPPVRKTPAPGLHPIQPGTSYDPDVGPPEDRDVKKHDDVAPTNPMINRIPPPPPGDTRNPEYAIKVIDKPGYVKSPYDPQGRLIDVRGLPPGTEAECPYTRRTFLVPP